MNQYLLVIVLTTGIIMVKVFWGSFFEAVIKTVFKNFRVIINSEEINSVWPRY